MERLNLDYLQPRSARRYAYYSVPKLLMDNPAFDGVDTDAKFLYSSMLERAALSAENADEYTDQNGHLFIIYTIEEVMKKRRCAKATAVKWVNQLSAIGLIEKKRRGQGKPTIIYVKDFSSIKISGNTAGNSRSSERELQEVQNVDFKKFNLCTSKSSDNEPQEVQGLNPIELDLKEPDLKDPPSIPDVSKGNNPDEGVEDVELLENQVKEQIDVEWLLESGYDKNQVFEVVRLITDTMCRAGPLTLSSGTIPESAVKKRMRELEPEHVAVALDALNSAKNISNPRHYLLAVLYNAPASAEIAITAKFNSDFG